MTAVQKTGRDFRIDNLKTVAILSVILAHMGLPETLLNIRTFDVVLLFLLAGANSVHSLEKESAAASGNNLYLQKLYSRIKKLLFPAWGIIFAVWAVVNLACCFLHREQSSYSFDNLILTLLLTNRGLGFIWIVKIFILATLFAPLFHRILKRVPCTTGVLLLTAALLLQGFLCHLLGLHRAEIPYVTAVILDDYVIGSTGYLIVSAIGIHFVLKKNSAWYYLSLNALIFCLCQYAASSFCPNHGKYPPNLYYLSWGLLISSLLWNAVSDQTSSFVIWISKNSWNIYLFHIPFYTVTFFMHHWLFRYGIVLTGAFLATLFWNKWQSYHAQKAL